MKVFLRAIIISALLLPAASFGGEIAKFQYALSAYVDDKGGGFQRPEGVACGPDSLFVAADTGNDRLVRFVLQGKNVKTAAEIKVPQLSRPLRAQIDSRGDILALDGKNRRIVRLDQEGRFENFLNPEGMPSSAAVVPRSFKLDRENNIYLLDVFSARVLVLDPKGKYLRQIEFPADYGFFSDLTVDPKGNVLLIDSVRAGMFSAAGNADRFSPFGGSLKEHLNFPVGIATDKRGTIYITDGSGHAVGIAAQDGSFLGKRLGMGWNEGLLYYPGQLCVNENDEVAVADTGNSRIQIFTLVK